MVERWARISFACVVAGLFALFAVCATWEPIQRDGWFHFAWYRDHELTGGAVWSFLEDNYLHGNPRIGEIVTFLTYAPGDVHVVTTPLAVIGTVMTMAAIVLGRWPSPGRPEHVQVLVLVAAMVVISVPGAGELFCYRPVVGNYVFGFLLVLLVLLPYRMHAVAPRSRGWGFALALFGLGVLAGMANEHTGLVTIAMLVASLGSFRRRSMRWAPWMVSGLAGLAIGCALLLLAPGQGERYDGLAIRESIVERVLARDVGETLLVFGFGGAAAALVIPWLLVGGLGRSARDPAPPPLAERERAAVWILALGGVAMVILLLASPKQGWRLVYAPALLWMCAAGIWLRPRLVGRTRALLMVLAAAGLGVQTVQLLRVQRSVHAEFAERMRRVSAAVPGAIVTLPSYSRGRSPWFQGDELDKRVWRVVIARTFGLTMVSPVPPAGAPALVLELEPPREVRVATRLAPAAVPEMRQACLTLAELPGTFAGYRLEGIDDAALGGRPLRACAHRAGVTIAPVAALEPAGRRAWRVWPERGTWQPAGPLDVHPITPRWRVGPAAPRIEDAYRIEAAGPGRHHVALCDRVECFLVGSVMAH